MLLRPVVNQQDQPAGFTHWCPACQEAHYIAVAIPLANGARWSFDGNMDAPTFSPSVRIEVPQHCAGDVCHPLRRCHYFIRKGRIEFCPDSTHALAGQTVQLPEWPR